MDFLPIIFILLVIYILYRMFSNSKVQTNAEYFSQAGVTVDYKTHKITIKGNTYDTSVVRGIEYRKNSSIGTEVRIKMNDIQKPEFQIGVMGIGNEGEKFVKRLDVALRKAGAGNFYLVRTN